MEFKRDLFMRPMMPIQRVVSHLLFIRRPLFGMVFSACGAHGSVRVTVAGAPNFRSLARPEEGAEFAEVTQPPHFYTRLGNPNTAQGVLFCTYFTRVIVCSLFFFFFFSIPISLGCAVTVVHFVTSFLFCFLSSVEALLKELEGSEAAIVVGSGMAAVSVCLLSNLKAGDHVVAQNTHYTSTLTLFTETLPKLGITVTQVDQTDTQAYVAVVSARCPMLYFTHFAFFFYYLWQLSTCVAAQHAHSVHGNPFEPIHELD
jgi:hypothetical protein